MNSTDEELIKSRIDSRIVFSYASLRSWCILGTSNYSSFILASGKYVLRLLYLDLDRA